MPDLSTAEREAMERLKPSDFGLSDEESHAFSVGVREGYRAALASYRGVEQRAYVRTLSHEIRRANQAEERIAELEREREEIPEELAQKRYTEHERKDGECNCEFPNWCLCELGFKLGNTASREAEQRERVLREALGDAGRQVRGICDDWVAEMGVGPTSDWLVQRFLPLADRLDAALAVSPEQPEEMTAELVDESEQSYKPCGLILIGSGTDTYDPVCDLREGHEGRCMSTGAIDQHKLAEYPPGHPQARSEQPESAGIPGSRVVEGDGTEGNMIAAGEDSHWRAIHWRAIIDALKVLQDRTIGSPEACGRAIDVLVAGLGSSDREHPNG